MSIPEPAIRDNRLHAASRDVAPRHQRGISLVELIMFIIIVSIGVVALLAVFNTTVRKSSDPVIQKQMLAIAESLLEEIESKPFTYCDPDDANATTAASPAGCTTPETIGPDAGETTRASYDNVGDYGGTQTFNPYGDVAGTTTIAGYSATVTVANTTGATSLNGLTDTEVLVITVTVNGPSNRSLTLTGYRTRYAPNATP